MGVMLYDKNADFSAFSLGHAGLYTSVTDGLQGLFELRRSAAKSRKNSAPDNDAEAQIVSGVTFNPTSIDLSAIGQVTFPSGPQNAGENSIAVILKAKTGGSATDVPVGSLPGTPAANGAAYIAHYNRRVSLESVHFNSQTAPSANGTNAQAFIDLPPDGSLDGSFQMFIATMKSEDSIKLYWPARGQVVSTAIAAGRYLYFNPSIANRGWRGLASGTATQGVSMFAHWNRVLSAGEVGTFYADMKKQFGLVGLNI